MSQWDTTTFQAPTEAELLEEEPLIEDLLTLLGSNEVYLNNQIAVLRNAHSYGDDIWDHFFTDPSVAGSLSALKWLELNGGVEAHGEADHYVEFKSDSGLHSRVRRRADKVPMVAEFRVKNEAFDGHVPWVGLADSFSFALNDWTTSVDATDGVWFTKGTNTNTYKAVSRSSSTDRTTTDNISANYVGWDLLRVELDASQARFYVDDVLAATHTVSLPTTALLRAGLNKHGPATGRTYLHVDWASFRALENSLSA